MKYWLLFKVFQFEILVAVQSLPIGNIGCCSKSSNLKYCLLFKHEESINPGTRGYDIHLRVVACIAMLLYWIGILHENMHREMHKHAYEMHTKCIKGCRSLGYRFVHGQLWTTLHITRTYAVGYAVPAPSCRIGRKYRRRLRPQFWKVAEPGSATMHE